MLNDSVLSLDHQKECYNSEIREINCIVLFRMFVIFLYSYKNISCWYFHSEILCKRYTVNSLAKENLPKTYARHCNCSVYNKLTSRFWNVVLWLALRSLLCLTNNSRAKYSKINCSALNQLKLEKYSWLLLIT